jgi:fumarate reductase flavoprotein subunit
MKKNTRLFFGITALVMAAMVVLAGCPQTEEVTLARMIPGTYSATGAGFSGTPFRVYVTVGDSVITKVELQEPFVDSPAVGNVAAPIMAKKILDYQTAGVDNVSGATMTSMGIKNAVIDALTQAGAPAEFTNPPRKFADNEKYTATENVDILIIGSGIAGLSAAVQAAGDTGGDWSTPTPTTKKIVVIEKQEMIGGSTKLAAGVVLATAAAGSIEDTSDRAALKAYYSLRGQGYIDTDLVAHWVDNSYETLGFLGINPAAAMPSGTMTENRMRFPGNFVSGTVNATGGNALVQMLADRARKMGVTILTGVKATELIKTGDAVTGVKAEGKNTYYTFNTVYQAGYPPSTVNGSVIIATGGFDSDRDGLMAEYNRDSRYDIPQSSKDNTGDGIKMAQAIGAKTVFKGGKIGWVGIDNSLGEANHYTAWIVKENGELLNYAAPGAQAAGTNSAGVAHPVLEASTYAANGGTGSTTPGAADYAVNHLKMLEARAAAGGNLKFYALYRGTSGPTSDPRFTKKAADIAALAQLSGMDTGKLTDAFTAAGLTSGSGDFVLINAIPSSIGSMGGIKINVNAEVLNNSDAVIPGLYAAGETANGDMFYREYPGSGSSLSISATFGRTAGEKAAARLP